MIAGADEFAKTVLSTSEANAEFKPFATYDPDGDCIEFYGESGSVRAERVNGLLTVYYSQETGQLIGGIIKHVAKLRDELLHSIPTFKIEIEDGKVQLHLLLRARLWTGSGIYDPEHAFLQGAG